VSREFGEELSGRLVIDAPQAGTIVVSDEGVCEHHPGLTLAIAEFATAWVPLEEPTNAT
jgi:hypothetical protein